MKDEIFQSMKKRTLKSRAGNRSPLSARRAGNGFETLRTDEVAAPRKDVEIYAFGITERCRGDHNWFWSGQVCVCVCLLRRKGVESTTSKNEERSECVPSWWTETRIVSLLEDAGSAAYKVLGCRHKKTTVRIGKREGQCRKQSRVWVDGTVHRARVHGPENSDVSKTWCVNLDSEARPNATHQEARVNWTQEWIWR